MTTLLIITTISILLSAFWLFKKPKTKYFEKTITKVHFIFLGLAILTIWLLVEDLRFIGQYTNSIIGLTFFTSGIILFGLTTSKFVKDKKDVPEMNPSRIIMIREIGNGWYIYKTT